MIKTLLSVALAAFFCACILPGLALAAEAAPAGLDLRPLIDQVAQLLIAGLSAVGIWVARLAAAKLRIQADSEAAAALERAILNGINLGGHKVVDLIAANLPPLRIQHALVADAAAYVLATMPDTIKRFGLTPEKVQDLVRARLPQPAAAPASPGPA